MVYKQYRMALIFPVSSAGKRSSANLCSYQGECEVLDPTRTYLFNANCGVILSSDATSLPQNWGNNKGAYDIYIGSNLTTWGNSLFRSNPRLTSIYVPPTSTQCGIYAFYDAADLHTVTLGGAYHTMGSYSFRYCNNLTRLNCCSPAPTLGLLGGTYGTFADCPNLTEVHVPVNGWAGTTSWLGLTVIHDLPAVTPEAGSTVAYDSAGNIVAYRPAAWTSIPNNWGSSNSNIHSVEIGSNVATIGSNVFGYCANLTGDVTFPGSVTSFGDFFGRSGANFDSITFSEGITTIGSKTFLQYTGNKAIELVMPSTLTHIEDEAFNTNHVNSWGQLYLNEGLQVMGQQVFRYNSNLGANQTLVIPSTMTNLNRWNFRGSKFNRIEIHAVIAPAINGEAFINMSYVADNSIHVPSNATGYPATISGYTVVYDLPAWVPASNESAGFNTDGTIINVSRATTIPANWLRYDADVASVVIGENVTYIGTASLRQHDATEINIPPSVTNIGTDAFFQASQQNIALNFSEGLQIIGGSAFQSSRYAGNIFLPTTLTTINNVAFTKINGDSTVRNYHINSPASVFTGTQIMRYHKVTDTLYVHADYLSQYDAAWKTAQAQDGLTIAEWTSYPDPMP